jgi:hypothetical protein
VSKERRPPRPQVGYVSLGEWGFAVRFEGDDVAIVKCRVCIPNRRRAHRRFRGVKLGEAGDIDEAWRVFRRHESDGVHQQAIAKVIVRDRQMIADAMPLLRAIDKWAGVA